MAAHYLNQQGLGNMSYRGNSSRETSASPSEFFLQNFTKNVSPEMLNLGLSAGQASIDRVVWQVWPGMSNFWTSLKTYFAVILFLNF